MLSPPPQKAGGGCKPVGALPGQKPGRNPPQSLPLFLRSTSSGALHWEPLETRQPGGPAGSRIRQGPTQPAAPRATSRTRTGGHPHGSPGGATLSASPSPSPSPRRLTARRPSARKRDQQQ